MDVVPTSILTSFDLLYNTVCISLSLLCFTFISPLMIYSICCPINYIYVVCGGSVR
jgi:hypothetical protein